MTSEAILILKTADAINFIVVDGTGIEKGSLLILTDPRTASTSVGTIGVPAGIVMREKIASDGRTRSALYRKGIFDLTLSPQSDAVTAGDRVAMSGANTIVGMEGQLGTNGANSKYTIGYALESADAHSQEVINVMVDM